MSGHAATFMFLLLALLLYAVGMLLPAVMLLLLGGVAELVFWYRLLVQGRNSPNSR